MYIYRHEPDYRDGKLDQPPVKIVEYANFLADVVRDSLLMLMQKLDGGKNSSRSPHSCRPPIAQVGMTPWRL
jgi:hypothetical protein